ncbi:hypothetical protein [Glutamicibacter nicotianae]|uniref:hypothetical protein n=1 Tax=Glutamicibacter nicotianae TaxID=37929 RepID=UPI00167FB49D|nr:hypothetical protein [Glutamicibacter nicotianae]
MGADEKHDATYHGLSDDTVRGRYCDGTHAQTGHTTDGAEYDTWLAGVKAEAKAEALQEVAEDLEDPAESPIWCWDKCGDPRCPDDIKINTATDIQKWLRDRANQYKENQ